MRRRGWFRLNQVGRTVERFLTAAVLVAQCFAIIAPLGDDHPVATTSQIQIQGSSSHAQWNVPQPDTAHHNAATCVACIAQSLVAARSANPVSVPLPGAVTELLDPFRTTPHSIAPGSRYQPRGPPHST